LLDSLFDVIHLLKVDPRDPWKVWAGTRRGLLLYDVKSNSVQGWHCPPVWGIVCDTLRDGIWIGTWNKGILQFDIPRVVVGENRNFEGNIPLLVERGVEVVLLDDPGCIALMERFIRERPELWNEDIAEEAS